MIKKFKEKLNNLPQEMQDYMLSEYGMSLESEIYEKYNLFGYNFSDFSDIVSLLYFQDLKLKDLVAYIHKNFYTTNDISAKIAADIVGMRLLVVKQFFKEENVEQYLKNSLAVDVSFYNKYVIRAKEELKREQMGYQAAQELEYERNKEEVKEKTNDVFVYVASDPKKEMEDSLRLFSKSLNIVLNAPSDAYLKSYNNVLVEILAENMDFKRNLERCLINNDELITEKKIVLEGKQRSPRVRNWIKDFVSNYGSGMFNNIVLSTYLGESENAKRLSEGEKMILRKLLLVYRNLKFFPDSMKDLPLSKWHIIPVEESGPVNQNKIREINRKEIESKIQDIEIDTSHKVVNAQDSVDAKQKKIEEMEAMRDSFEDGSLERMAINEEINKLKKM